MENELYLTEEMREKILKYDIDYSEFCDDRELFYIRNTEEYILENILSNMWEDDLKKLGFDEEIIEVISYGEFKVGFTIGDKNYLLKGD